MGHALVESLAVGAAPVVTLTTDFGTADGYVAAMKGVILSMAPEAHLIDVSHLVPPHDVHHGAFVVHTMYRFFPEGSIHVAVVDPGVGGQRRGIAIVNSSAYFVGPDNGLFSYVLASEPPVVVVELSSVTTLGHPVSHTFHGRDVFAPAAARLAAGVPIAQLGLSIRDPLVFVPHLKVSREGVDGEVLHVDRFGNLVTSIGRFEWGRWMLSLTPFGWAAELEAQSAAGRPPGGSASKGVLRLDPEQAIVAAGGTELRGIRRAYSEADRGDAIALIGSGGHLELAVREGSAASVLGLQRGDRVQLALGSRDVRWESHAADPPDDIAKGALWTGS